MDWNLVKEELFRNYKKEFYLWIGIAFFLGLGLFLFIKEYKKFTVNLQALKRVETIYQSRHREIMKLKEELKKINLNATQRIVVTPFSGVYDLRDLNRAFLEIKALTQGEGHFFILKELMLLKGKEGSGDISKLKINGELVIFTKGGS